MRVGFEEFLLTRRWPVLVLLALLTTLAGLAYGRFVIENRLDAWFDADDPSYQRYRLLRDSFEKQEQVFVVVHAADVFERDVLERIDRLTTAAAALPEVQRATSLTSIEDISGTPDGVLVAPLVPMEALDDVDLGALRARVLGDPFFPGVIVSRDGRTTIVAVELVDGSAATNVGVVRGLERAVAAVAAPGITTRLAGWPAVNVLLDELTQADVTRGMPIMLLILASGLVLAFRSVGPVLVISVGVLFVIVWTMGSFAGAGYTGTFLTVSALPAILLALTLATGVHVVARVQEERRRRADLRDAIARAVEGVALPVLTSCATTAIGFGSLSVSTLPPVRHLGYFAALGTLYIGALCLSVVPLGLVSAPPPAGIPTAAMATRPLEWIARFTTRHARRILVVSALVAGVAFLGLLRLQPQGNGLTYLPQSSAPLQAMHFIEDHYGGATDVEVLVQSEDRALLDPALASVVASAQTLVAGHEDTTDASSYTDLLRRMHRALNDGAETAYRLPESAEAIAQELLLYETSGGDELDTWIDPSSHAIARIRGHTTSFQTIDRMGEYYGALEAGLAALRAAAPRPVELTITGNGPLWYRVNRALLTTMAQSFLVALTGVTLVMVLVMRSVRLGLIAMIPNLLPVLVAVGGMGWAGVRLDFATVMVAGITLGIAVDDTIHYLYRYRQELGAHRDPVVAVARTLDTVGRAMVTTSLVLFFGFGLMTLSSFPPHQTFGIVIACTMLVALASDLFVLPALLLLAPGMRPGASAT